MDWKIEVIKLIDAYFKSIGVKYKPNVDIHRCLIDFLNLEMKIIKPVPRTILKSNKLKSLLIPIKYAKAFKYIEQKIHNGSDITYHFSKQTLDPSYNDLLLNDWYIRHIHLSDVKSQKGQKFYDRSKYLLFCAFNNSQAFLIDIREHNEQNVFAKKELLEIIDNNWPQALKIIHDVDEVIPGKSYSDSDIDMLRRKGYTIGMTEVNGKIVMNPGLGITTSGHNMFLVGKANDIMRYLHEAMDEIDKDRQAMKNILSQEIGYDIKELDLCIHKLDKHPFFAVYENNSKCYIEKNYSTMNQNNNK